MKKIILKIEPFPIDVIHKRLDAYGILTNDYAEEFFAHPCFKVGYPREISLTIALLEEIGLDSGAALNEIFMHIPKVNLKPCASSVGLFLRLAWLDQPQSQNSIISGTHSSPDMAVTVLSEILEEDDNFPKGLYLRNVDSNLLLRGYICDDEYRFPSDAIFAFEDDVSD